MTRNQRASTASSASRPRHALGAAPLDRPRRAAHHGRRVAPWREREKMAYVIIDGTLIPIDRIAADRPFCSGRHKRHGVNLQVIASPDGTILSVSGELSCNR